MNLSDNQVKRERQRLLCLIQSISSLTKATETKACFQDVTEQKKAFHPLYEISPQKKKKKKELKKKQGKSHQEAG